MNAPQLVSVIDRIPPNNLEAEMALLGSVLVDREMMATVSEIVRPEDFYASLHEAIYLALVALHDAAMMGRIAEGFDQTFTFGTPGAAG